MRVLLLDTEENAPKIIETDGELEHIYQLLRCSYIDIAYRSVAGRAFDIIIDDAGFCQEDVKITAVDRDREPQLAGNLIFCHHNEDGSMVGLSNEDIDHLLGHILLAVEQKEHPRHWIAMGDVE